jgi:hypothetical protein
MNTKNTLHMQSIESQNKNSVRDILCKMRNWDNLTLKVWPECGWLTPYDGPTEFAKILVTETIIKVLRAKIKILSGTSSVKCETGTISHSTFGQNVDSWRRTMDRLNLPKFWWWESLYKRHQDPFTCLSPLFMRIRFSVAPFTSEVFLGSKLIQNNTFICVI